MSESFSFSGGRQGSFDERHINEAIIEDARQRSRRRRLRAGLALALVAAAAGSFVYARNANDGPGEASPGTSPLPVTVPAVQVIKGTPYMGIACASPDALSCDRVGVSVRLKEPAHDVTAVLGGKEFALDDPDYSETLQNGEASRFAGYLHPAGLREPGPLHVLGQARPGRDRWLDRAPNKFRVKLTIERKDGSLQATTMNLWLAPGWG